MGSKFGCPVCGCPTEKINANPTDHMRALYKCPQCGAVLEGKGRVWWLVEKSATPQPVQSGDASQMSDCILTRVLQCKRWGYVPIEDDKSKYRLDECPRCKAKEAHL